jgi:hypothetical protein
MSDGEVTLFTWPWGVMKKGGAFEMFRRATILLSSLRWADVASHLETNQPLIAELSLTDAKGGPLCASVKPPHIRWRAWRSRGAATGSH